MLRQTKLSNYYISIQPIFFLFGQCHPEGVIIFHLYLFEGDRQGLRGLRPRLEDAPQKPPPALQVLCDPTAPSDLPNLAGVQPVAGNSAAIGKTLSRLAEPVANWNVENVKMPSVRVSSRSSLNLVFLFTLSLVKYMIAT